MSNQQLIKKTLIWSISVYLGVSLIAATFQAVLHTLMTIAIISCLLIVVARFIKFDFKWIIFAKTVGEDILDWWKGKQSFRDLLSKIAKYIYSAKKWLIPISAILYPYFYISSLPPLNAILFTLGFFLIVIFLVTLIIYTFKDINWFSYFVLYKRLFINEREAKLVRLKIIPSSKELEIFNVRQEITKALHGTSELPAQVGKFASGNNVGLEAKNALTLSLQRFQLDVLRRAYHAFYQPHDRYVLGVMRTKEEIYQYIEVPESKVEDVIRICKSYDSACLVENLGEVKQVQGNTYQGDFVGDWRMRIKTFKDKTSDPYSQLIKFLEGCDNDVEIRHHIIPFEYYYNAVVSSALGDLGKEVTTGMEKQSKESALHEGSSSVLFGYKMEINIAKGGKDADNIKDSIKSCLSLLDEPQYCSIEIVPGFDNNGFRSVVAEAELWGLFHFDNSSPYIKTNRYLPIKPVQELLNKEWGKVSNKIGWFDYDTTRSHFLAIDSDRDKNMHMSIEGPTGRGKTEFQVNLIIQDILKGKAIFYIDLKGGGINRIIENIPDDMRDRVILIDPITSRIPIRMLDESEHSIQIFQEIIDVISNQKGYEGFGNKMEFNINNILEIAQSQAEASGKKIKAQNLRKIINKILNDKDDFRTLKQSHSIRLETFGHVISNTPEVRLPELFLSTIGAFDKLFKTDRVIEMVDNPNAKLDFEKCVREKKIVLINLPEREDFPEMERVALGIIYAVKIKYALLANYKYKEEDMIPGTFFIDEAQTILNYSAEQFRILFEKVRGAKWSMVISNQNLSQLEPELYRTIISNVAASIVLGSTNGVYSKELAEHYQLDEQQAKSLMYMPEGHGLAGMVQGSVYMPACTFSFDMLPKDPEKRDENFRYIIDNTQKHYQVLDDFEKNKPLVNIVNNTIKKVEKTDKKTKKKKEL